MKKNNDIRTIYNYKSRISRINRINREIKKLIDELNSNYLFDIRNIIMKHRRITEHTEAKEMNMSITEYREYERRRKILLAWMREKIAKLQRQKIFYIYKFVYQKQQKTQTNRNRTQTTIKHIDMQKIQALAKMYI